MHRGRQRVCGARLLQGLPCLVLLGAFLLPHGGAGGAAAQDAAPPRAVVAEAEQNLGVLAPGQGAVARFAVTNRGGAPLHVAAGKPIPLLPGLRVEVEAAPVAPGGTATVVVTLDTATLAGPGTVRVPLETNDPESQRLVVSLSVDVQPLLFADPGYARYNVVQQEGAGTIAQTVWSSDAASFRVLAVESPHAELRVSFREAAADERRDAAGSQWRVESVLMPDAAVGALAGNLVVVTDHPRQKELRIPLSGFVRPVLAVTPPVAEVGDVDGARPFRFVLDVKTFATEEIALERAEADLPGATVDVVTIRPGRAYKVRVAVPAGLPAGALSGAVRIFTASAKAPRIEVPIRGRVVTKDAPADAR